MDYLKGLLAGPEAAMSIGSGLLAQPLSGLAGLLALPAGPERAANVVRNTQQRLTYQPQTEGGQRVMGALAPVGEAVGNFWTGLQRATGDAGYAVGGPLGGALGSAIPDAAAMLPVGVLARGLRGAPQRFPLPNQQQAGAIVYHGSPHKFDRFDSSKIGTGEGAQAYGHGLYLADNPSVAKSYQVERTNGGYNPFNFFAEDGNYHKSGGRYFKNNAEIPKDEYSQAFVDAQKKWQEQRGGAFYKVDLPDSAIEKMLDWDKPLSQQPEAVRVAAMDLGLPPTATGKDIYAALANHSRDMAIINANNAQTTLPASQAAASENLRGYGIPGIRYLDGGSRTAGEGTRNYVVFPGNEGLLKILERQ